MFTLIGADGRQYGPVPAEQVRQWLAENRANLQTRVLVEGSSDWRNLGSIPEFAPPVPPSGPAVPPPISLPPVAPPPSASGSSNRVAAGVCGILLGGLGVHKFILGYTGAGLIMLLVSVLSCGVFYAIMHIIGLIEGIIYLTKSDEEFTREYVQNRKEWF